MDVVKIKSYRDLYVWQLAKQLVKDVYEITNHFPKHEHYGLTQQVRRAAVSIPSNIAEGHARASRKEFLQFLSIALGSLAEVETQLEIAVDLAYIGNEDIALAAAKGDRLGKMMRTLIKTLKSIQPQVPSLQPLLKE